MPNVPDRVKPQQVWIGPHPMTGAKEETEVLNVLGDQVEVVFRRSGTPLGGISAKDMLAGRGWRFVSEAP